MKKGKVSIIVPVYQAKDYIRSSVESLLGQTYNNIEILLIDDGSNDGSEIICDELAKMHTVIKTIHQDNKGVSAARNSGIQQAKGEYLLFVDSDDFISPLAVEQLMKIIEQTKADIIFFDFIKVYSKQKVDVSANITEGLYSSEEFSDVFLQLVKTNIANNIGTKLYNAELIKNNNLLFSEKYNICEDISFCLNATRKSKQVYYLKEKLYFYNIHENGSLMSSYKENFFEAERELYENIKHYLQEHNQFSKHANDYYDLYMTNILTVLFNEIIYNKNVKEVFYKIMNDENVQEAMFHLKDLSVKKRFVYNLIWKRKYHMFYIFSKLYLKLM
ncbi:glycosyltransferase family 2 protein [Peribacillus sp. R9-11]|uniref:glycosyltransferase family 2 protein n=1 Tax=Peribacillus sp. R9-11 TaxID=3073271 RepID=UPI0028688E65|nr:glycosyltransferase family 2 protein [Peribacillus sp. R9-11]WMX54272.1 glycosyltransferase family 2 protein [Peribacillus sp. R9-11]